mmetsp:Transcript_44961/g.71831  ORF Transcript_44961/g.71831 Transcript_44961/m.71831 type:complete len:177 (-) Transcript_44961:1237-1767(-)
MSLLQLQKQNRKQNPLVVQNEMLELDLMIRKSMNIHQKTLRGQNFRWTPIVTTTLNQFQRNQEKNSDEEDDKEEANFAPPRFSLGGESEEEEEKEDQQAGQQQNNKLKAILDSSSEEEEKESLSLRSTRKRGLKESKKSTIHSCDESEKEEEEKNFAPPKFSLGESEDFSDDEDFC